jgi:hypothetical protein
MTTDEARPPLWRHPILVSALAGFGLLFAAGIATGVVAGSLERGAMKPLAAAVMLGALALVAGCGWLLWRTLPGLYAETSPRVTRSRRLLTVSAAVGGALGLLLTLGALATGQEPPDVFSNAPIAGWIALATIGVWLLVVPALTWKWHRSIDEHEASAYRDGTLAGIYAYCAIAPTWWFGWRGGFLPEPQEMVTFLIVVVVWGLVWLTRRYA